MPSSSILEPFQLLEVNIISAQDLARVCRNMRTYAVAWVHPDRKLSTRVDTESHTNPTWNDKFVFRVDDDFLSGYTSAVMIEIYAHHWFKDIHVGTVRAMVSNVVPPPAAAAHREGGMRIVALQVRRPSGRPQGILNIGVTVLAGSMRSMPLYNQLGFRESSSDTVDYKNDNVPTFIGTLRRTQSDSSSMALARRKDGPEVVGFIGENGKASSMVSGSTTKKRKRSSVAGGSKDKKGKRGGSVINASEPNKGTTRGIPDSIVLGSAVKESEVGSSPWEVDARDMGSLILGAWEREDDWRSKLERWRAEVPPMYDQGGAYSVNESSARGPDRDPGLLSCFGNICGMECSVVCGGQNGRTKRYNRVISDDLSYK